MVLTPIEIFFRDIGDASTTGFKYDREVMTYVEANPHLDEDGVIHGMIHSHHTMGVFFSPTDVSELQVNVHNHNIYLSLVINNYMDMAAKVAFVGVNSSPDVFTCPDEEGGTYELEIEHEEKVMMVYDVAIEKPQAEEIPVDRQFKQIFQEVRMKVNKRNEEEAKKKAEEAKKKAEAAKGNPNMAVSKSPGTANGGYGSHGYPQNYSGFHEGNKAEEITDQEPDDFDDFFSYCFSGGCHSPIDSDAWVKRLDLEKAGEEVTNSIMDNYATYYQNFYEVDTYGMDSDHFEECIQDFIDYCDFGSEDFPWLDTLCSGLVAIKNKFIELNLNQKVNEHAEI